MPQTQCAFEEELAKAIEIAAGKAISALFAEHPERFYYCSLITSGYAHPPVLTAWSVEALEREARKRQSPQEREWLKWSYGESPYFAYGEAYFEDVRRLFDGRPTISLEVMTEEECAAEYELRLRAMEAAMSRLDAKGLFGEGKQRLGLVINVEVAPPDFTNTERALRLNPPDALTVWLREAAEPLPR